MTDDHLSASELEGRLVWAIATGGVQDGERLPSLRKGARQWDTSVHVVREAYRRLVAAGLIEIHQGSQARVVSGTRTGHPALDIQVRRFVREVAGSLRVSPAEVLAAVERQVHATLPAVTVVECSTTLADSIARQLRRRWRVRTALHRLGDGTMPTGALLSTWFHRRELKAASRRDGTTVSFLRLQPSPESMARVRRWVGLRPGSTITLLETDPALAANVVRVLGAAVAGVAFDVRIAAAGAATPRALASLRGAFCLVSPRHWDELAEAQRLQPGVALLDYTVAVEDLVAVGVAQEWLAGGGGC
jgi:DNA-binding transcriptional regulator YhcF (GntR family)